MHTKAVVVVLALAGSSVSALTLPVPEAVFSRVENVAANCQVIKTVPAQTAAQCQTICAATPACDLYTFATKNDGACNLQKDCGAGSFTRARKAVTGLRGDCDQHLGMLPQEMLAHCVAPAPKAFFDNSGSVVEDAAAFAPAQYKAKSNQIANLAQSATDRAAAPQAVTDRVNGIKDALPLEKTAGQVQDSLKDATKRPRRPINVDRARALAALLESQQNKKPSLPLLPRQLNNLPADPLSLAQGAASQLPVNPLSTAQDVPGKLPVNPLSTAQDAPGKLPVNPLSTAQDVPDKLPVNPLSAAQDALGKLPVNPLSTAQDAAGKLPVNPLSAAQVPSKGPVQAITPQAVHAQDIPVVNASSSRLNSRSSPAFLAEPQMEPHILAVHIESDLDAPVVGLTVA